MANVFVGLGTNVGNKKQNLSQAIKELEKAGIVLKKKSSIYETEPIGVIDQQWFYNMVIEVQADLLPEELLKEIKRIEKEIGREQTYKWGPRLIDIDLLLYDDLEVDKETETGHLKLPHDQLTNRAFVIEPLIEIEPDISMPSGERIIDFAEQVRDQRIKKIS